MEVFIRNVPFHCEYHQVQREIASVLHTAEFNHHGSQPGPLNFRVHLLPDKRGSHKHGGVGKLTLPSVVVGELFLQEFSGPAPRRFISMGNRILQFSRSHDRVRKAIVEEITRMPYVDPIAKEKLEKLRIRFEVERVKVSSLQFGWVTRDWSFSSEYEKSCTSVAYLTFDEEARAIRIKIEGLAETQIIFIRFSNISYHTAGRDSDGFYSLFFALQVPPTFEVEVPRLDLDLARLQSGSKGNVYDVHPRQRRSALDDVHALASAYTSCALRLVCRGKDDISTFRSLSKEAGLSDPHSSYDLPVVHRAIFSSHALGLFRQWMQSIDWTVSFQLEAITRELIVDVKEILQLREYVDALLRRQGVKKTALILHYFAVEMQEVNEQGVNKEGQVETVTECFARCMRDFKPKKIITPKQRLSDDVFDCFHIYASVCVHYFITTNKRLDNPLFVLSSRSIP
jgi:RNA-dependent RNA polymerase